MTLIQQALEVLDRAEVILAKDEPILRQQAARLLHTFRGIPARLNWIDVVSQSKVEAVHTRLLAFFLEPDGDHGIGDVFLRRFLALGSTEMRERAKGDIENVSVRTEYDVAGVGRPDIVINFGTKLAVVIEVKIDAPLTRDTNGVPQTRRYVQALIASPNLVGATTTTFVFIHSAPTQTPDDEEDASTNHLWSRLPWVEVERLLYALTQERELPKDTLALIAVFRTSILGRVTGHLRAIEKLRQLIALDAKTRPSLRAAKLQSLVDDLVEVGFDA